jgi:hypothetical protein
MRKNLLYKSFLFCSSIFQMVNCQAQSSFQYKSILSDIKSAGFYKVVLPPAIVAKSKNELNDIRILNDKGNQVPYVLKSDKPEFQEKNFIEFPILGIKREADKQTHIVIQNKTNKTVNELLLVIKNTDAERTVTLSGSDDQKQWFVIKEHISLSNVFIREQDRFVQSLNFPTSSYNFFELIINGKDLLPVNVVRVGVYEDVLRNGGFVSIPDPTIIQKDSSDKLSYISLTFNESYLVNKLQLHVQGPKFFRRHITIHMDEAFNYSLNDYILSSGVDASYNINIKAKKILLIIDNQDNPPITLQSVKAYQLNKYLLAYLEPAIKYELVFGDSTVSAPKYDLEFFKDSLNNTVSEVRSGPINKIDAIKNISKQAGNKSMLTLWIIIVAVLALLLILTFRMTKEVAKKNNNS